MGSDAGKGFRSVTPTDNEGAGARPSNVPFFFVESSSEVDRDMLGLAFLVPLRVGISPLDLPK